VGCHPSCVGSHLGIPIVLRSKEVFAAKENNIGSYYEENYAFRDTW
jgi:hypothetical protein